MFISISAAALSKYKWFTYQGKRAVSFKNHHKTHELVLQPKDRFGVRTYAGKLRVVDIADPSTVFVLSEKEVRRIVGRSKGYSGRVKGEKLVAGEGGLDSPAKTGSKGGKTPRAKQDKAPRKTRVYRPDGEYTDYDPKYFPEIKMPPDKKEILRLYHYFNKLHFNRELPDNLTVKLSPAHRFSGQAMYTRKNGPPEYIMRIGKKALTDIPRIIDVVLHEMIHILHYKRAYGDNNAAYLNASHGPLFVEEMHRLNKFGYRINLTEDKLQEAKLPQSQYVMMVETSRNGYLIIHGDKDFKSKIPALLDTLRGRVSHNVTMLKVMYGKTKSSYVFLGSKLTNRFAIPKSPRLQLFPGNTDAVKGILKDLDVKLEETLKRDLVGVRPKVESAVDQVISVIQQPLGTYYKYVMTAAGFLKRDWIPGNQWREAAESMFSAEERDFIEDTWKRAEDRHFINSNLFAGFKKGILKDGLDGESAAEYLAWKYLRYFDGKDERVDSTRFINIAVEALGDIITVPDSDFISMLREELHKVK